MEKIYIVIPAYNEATQIGRVIADLRKNGYENILVVNDGSKDATEENAKNAGAEVLTHLVNLGQGAALRTGIEYLRKNKHPDIIVTFDADGQHRAEDIAKLACPVLEKKHDIALGSRFLGTRQHVPFLKKIVLKLGIFFTTLVSGVKLTDTHNGLRALGKKAIQKISLTQSGMEHASEIIDEMAKNKLRYIEVPVEVLYTDYSKQKGQSIQNCIRIAAKTLLKKIIR